MLINLLTLDTPKDVTYKICAYQKILSISKHCSDHFPCSVWRHSSSSPHAVQTSVAAGGGVERVHAAGGGDGQTLEQRVLDEQTQIGMLHLHVGVSLAV